MDICLVCRIFCFEKSFKDFSIVFFMLKKIIEKHNIFIKKNYNYYVKVKLNPSINIELKASKSIC